MRMLVTFVPDIFHHIVVYVAFIHYSCQVQFYRILSSAKLHFFHLRLTRIITISIANDQSIFQVLLRSPIWVSQC